MTPDAGAPGTAPRPLSARQLPLQRVLVDHHITTLRDLCAVIAQSAANGNAGQAARIEAKLLARHARASPALGFGIALPHAAVAGVSSPIAVFVRSTTVLDIYAPDGSQTKDVLALLVRLPGLAADHDLLMGVTTFLTCPATRGALNQARTREEIHAVLTTTPEPGPHQSWDRPPTAHAGLSETV